MWCESTHLEGLAEAHVVSEDAAETCEAGATAFSGVRNVKPDRRESFCCAILQLCPKDLGGVTSGRSLDIKVEKTESPWATEARGRPGPWRGCHGAGGVKRASVVILEDKLDAFALVACHHSGDGARHRAGVRDES